MLWNSFYFLNIIFIVDIIADITIPNLHPLLISTQPLTLFPLAIKSKLFSLIHNIIQS